MDTATNLGFITVIQESSGYLGGYLVTNSWGRPLEFRLSTPVQPNRVQNILYGTTLKPYIYADLIGKALVEKTATVAQLIVTDCEPLLDLRLRTTTPVVWLADVEDMLAQSLERAGASVHRSENGLLLCHPKFISDATAIQKILNQIDATDLMEPFSRIREALGEARKMGNNRAA